MTNKKTRPTCGRVFFDSVRILEFFVVEFNNE